MNVLSLFDGMSCGQIALNRCGIEYENYFASEIDKFAISVTQANYPKTLQIGDVNTVKAKDLPKIDLLIGGSPCQGFSFAGKQLNFNDPRSKLFFEYVRILKECNPRYFFLENVKMKKEYQNIISSYLGVEPIEINSSLVSAQNRKRLYWTNIPDIIQPEDKKIVLKDILIDKLERCGALRDRYFVEDHKKVINQVFELRNDYKTNTLTTVQKDNLIFIAGIKNGRRIFSGKMLSREFREGSRVYSINGKSATLTSQSKGGKGGYSGLYGEIKEDTIICRTLIPLECERLQTVPDGYTNYVSDTQRYKMLGNGWTIDIISHIFNNLPKL